jgi:hypothetical protein
VLLNANNTITELTGTYTPEVKSLSLENVIDINGVVVVAERLAADSAIPSTVASTGSTDIQPVNMAVNPDLNAVNANAADSLSASGVALNDTANIQDRPKGSSMYLLVLGLLLVVTMGGAIAYRKV